MHTQLSLWNLPDVVARIIFNRVGFKSILNLRKVCRDLRNRIDDIKPEVNLLNVLIDVSDYEIRFEYESQDVEQSGVIWCEVEYERTVESGRSIVRSRGSEKIVNGEFLELASRDFQLILKFHKKRIEEILVNKKTGYSNNLLQFLDTVKSFLALENRLLKVDYFTIETNDQKSVIAALSLIDPQSIYSITIANLNESNQSMDIAEIMEMEHWKTAKRFESDSGITGVSAYNFRHFSIIILTFQSISAEELLDFKKIFENSSEAKLFIIQYETFKDREQFLEKMGPPVTFEDEFNWYFRMSTTGDNVLLIQLHSFKSIMFRREAVADVPEDAVIQN